MPGAYQKLGDFFVDGFGARAGRKLPRDTEIPADEFAATIGVTVHRVSRLEPWVLQHRNGSFEDLVSGVEAEAIDAAADPRCVAFKSVVAYRTGLDIGDPSSSDAAAVLNAVRSATGLGGVPSLAELDMGSEGHE